MSALLQTKEGKAVSFAKEQRLTFIDKTLATQGYINRSDLTDRFRITAVTAAKDIKLYNSLTPQVNAVYSFGAKRYERTTTFAPLFPNEVKYNG